LVSADIPLFDAHADGDGKMDEINHELVNDIIAERGV